MHIQILECHFSSGFLAEGRRGQAKMLENTLKKCLKTHFQNLQCHFPPGFVTEGRRGQAQNF